jgi:tetratricopeptide (TPR) repeat protein
VQKLDVPLAEATTSSLEALKAFSLGDKALNEKGEAAALPYHQRAIELDPNFAMGYAAVGSDYFSLAELGRASEYFTKAFQLREHASEREKLDIAAAYYSYVTGELDKAAQTYQQSIESYPRDFRAYGNLGTIYGEQGQYEKAAEVTKQPVRFAPDNLTKITSISPTSPLPCGGSTKRGRAFTRCRREKAMITYSTTLSMLLPFSGRTLRLWPNSKSGMRASPKRTLDWGWHPTPRHMLVMWAKRGN